MPLPAAAYLVEFRPSQAGHKAALGSGAVSLPSPLIVDDIAAAEAIDAAFARGRDDGLAAARADFEPLLEEERARATERLAAERRDWVENHAERLAQRLATCAAELTSQIADAVGGVLTPFLDEAMRKAAVDDLVRKLETLVAGGQGKVITVSGPEDLLRSIGERLGGAVACAFEPSDHIDVRVTVDSTVVETQLAAWRGRLEEASG